MLKLIKVFSNIALGDTIVTFSAKNFYFPFNCFVSGMENGQKTKQLCPVYGGVCFREWESMLFS